MNTELTAKITSIPDARAFMLAGRAIFTWVSLKTGNRFTYRVRRNYRPGMSGTWSVDVLTGSNNDNDNDYTFAGTISDPVALQFKHSVRSRIPLYSPSIVALQYLVDLMHYTRDFPEKVEFWHSGHCSRCGRLLTDPESIGTGLGPVCRSKVLG